MENTNSELNDPNLNEEIRVRLAPSPTGKLHIGLARSALFNYLFAKKNSGKFILRLEDTDKKRSKEEYALDIIDNLNWLGLSWDEGPILGGEYGPYLQSERLDIYEKYIKQLLENNLAYYCYCSIEELEKERQTQLANHQPPRYSGKCQHLTEEEIAAYKKANRLPVIRFKIQDGEVAFKDIIRGDIKFNMKDFSDFVIVDSKGQPLFLLTNAIDDALMKISHVLRGEDHITNTPKQILLLQALNFLPPEYGHLPLILNADRSKLSKRKNPTSVQDDYRNKGFLPDAMINFMVFLGWAPSDNKEFFTMDQLIREFSLEQIGKSPAIFDLQKLENVNGHYIRRMSLGDLSHDCIIFLCRDNPQGAKIAQKNPQYYLQIVSMLQDRMKSLSDIVPLSKFFFTDDLDYDPSLLIPNKQPKEKVAELLKASQKLLEKNKSFGRDELEQDLRNLADGLGVKAGEILWPVRVAITGEKASPGVFEVLSVLGKEKVIKRLDKAIEKLGIKK